MKEEQAEDSAEEDEVNSTGSDNEGKVAGGSNGGLSATQALGLVGSVDPDQRSADKKTIAADSPSQMYVHDKTSRTDVAQNTAVSAPVSHVTAGDLLSVLMTSAPTNPSGRPIPSGAPSIQSFEAPQDSPSYYKSKSGLRVRLE